MNLNVCYPQGEGVFCFHCSKQVTKSRNWINAKFTVYVKKNPGFLLSSENWKPGIVFKCIY